MNLMSLLGNKDVMKVVMQAIGSMMRGENPVTFMKNLAKTNPLFQGYNFDDLEGTARDICKQRNVDMENMKSQIEEFANSHIN